MLKEVKAFQAFLESKNSPSLEGDSIFKPVGDLSILESLKIYEVNQREGRFNALKKFYEVTERFLGESEFRRIGIGFVLRNPSQSFTLANYHGDFPRFLKSNVTSHQDFFFDLAHFEWAWHRLSRTNFKFQSDRILDKIPDKKPSQTFLVNSPSVIVEKFSYMISPSFREWKSSKELSETVISGTPVSEHFVLFWRSEPTTRQRLVLNFWQAHLVKLISKSVSLDQIIFNIIQHSSLTPKLVTEFIFDLIHRKVIVDIND